MKKESNRFFLWCGIISPIVMIQATVIMGAVDHEYSHIQSTVSELGSPGAPYAWIFNSALILFGFMLILFAFGLWDKLQKGKLASLFIAFMGILNIIGGIYPIDMMNLESQSSLIHSVSGMLLFVTYIIAMFLFSRSTKDDPRFKKTRGLMNLFWILGLFGMVGTLTDQSWTGLAQRVFYMGYFGALAVIGASLLRIKSSIISKQDE